MMVSSVFASISWMSSRFRRFFNSRMTANKHSRPKLSSSVGFLLSAAAKARRNCSFFRFQLLSVAGVMPKRLAASICEHPSANNAIAFFCFVFSIAFVPKTVCTTDGGNAGRQQIPPPTGQTVAATACGRTLWAEHRFFWIRFETGKLSGM